METRESFFMPVMEAVRTRRSIRNYLDKPVEKEKLDLIMEAARNAPSARNEQMWRFIVVRDPDLLKLLYAAAYEQPAVREAPCAIVACGTGSRVMDCGQPTDTVNLSIAMAYILLEAHEQGLGTCWLGRFDADAVRAALGIPADVSVVAFTPLGYPAVVPEARPRKPVEEVVSWDKY